MLKTIFISGNFNLRHDGGLSVIGSEQVKMFCREASEAARSFLVIYEPQKEAAARFIRAVLNLPAASLVRPEAFHRFLTHEVPFDKRDAEKMRGELQNGNHPSADAAIFLVSLEKILPLAAAFTNRNLSDRIRALMLEEGRSLRINLARGNISAI